MRITIEIDGTETAVTTGDGAAAGVATGADGAVTPPADLLARAAAVGAASAGAAPSGPPSGTTAFPSPPLPEATTAPPAGDLGAGAAPGAATEPPTETTEMEE